MKERRDEGVLRPVEITWGRDPSRVIGFADRHAPFLLLIFILRKDFSFAGIVSRPVQTSTSTLTLICFVIPQDDFSRGRAVCLHC